MRAVIKHVIRAHRARLALCAFCHLCERGMTVKTERMKRFIIGFLLLSLLLPVLASCGAGMEAESETVSTYVPKARDYKIERIDGEDYLVFDDEAYEYYRDQYGKGDHIVLASREPGVFFASASAFREALATGAFDKTDAVIMIKKEENGLPLGNLDRLLVLDVDESFEDEAYVWDGRRYEHRVQCMDGMRMKGVFYSRKEDFDHAFQSLYEKSHEKYPSEVDEERNATVTYLPHDMIAVRYTLETSKKTLYVCETHIPMNDLGKNKEVLVDIFAVEPEQSFYYHISVDLPNRTDEPIDEEWLLSIGVQLAP